MDMLKGMNGALDYIENNLDGHIDLGEVAKRAYCSSIISNGCLLFIRTYDIRLYPQAAFDNGGFGSEEPGYESD